MILNYFLANQELTTLFAARSERNALSNDLIKYDLYTKETLSFPEKKQGNSEATDFNLVER